MSQVSGPGAFAPRRRRNDAAWNLVGALLSTLYSAALYGIPLWGFAAGWIGSRNDWYDPEAAFAAHATLTLAWLTLWGLSFIYTWSSWMSRRFLHVAGAVVATVVIVAGVVVSRSEGPPGEVWLFDYRGWTLLMVLIATLVAAFDIAYAIAAARGTRRPATPRRPGGFG